MKYSDFIKSVAERVALPQAQVKKVLEESTDTIMRTVADGDEVSIPEFGKFKLKVRAARKGVNPATGEKISIPAAKDVAFKLSSQVKKDLNA